jgi:hypothetical protein
MREHVARVEHAVTRRRHLGQTKWSRCARAGGRHKHFVGAEATGSSLFGGICRLELTKHLGCSQTPEAVRDVFVERLGCIVTRVGLEHPKAVDVVVVVFAKEPEALKAPCHRRTFVGTLTVFWVEEHSHDKTSTLATTHTRAKHAWYGKPSTGGKRPDTHDQYCWVRTNDCNGERTAQCARLAILFRRHLGSQEVFSDFVFQADGLARRDRAGEGVRTGFGHVLMTHHVKTRQVVTVLGNLTALVALR